MNVLNPTVKTIIVSKLTVQTAVKNKAHNPGENKGQGNKKLIRLVFTFHT